nr:hypothetical protein BaRGS_029098 [Batillaria attramentaria]
MKRSAMPVFLTALAVSDMSLLYTGLLRRWIMNMFDLDIRALNYVVCKVHTWLVYATVIVSAWLLTFMTVERALSVWVPYRVSLLCTRRKACVIIAAVVLSSLGVNAHFLYGMDILSDVNGTYRECGARDEEYLYFFDAVWSWVDLTLSSLIPFTVLIIGNGLILWKVSRSARKARTLTAGCPEGVLQRKKKVSSMTVTLIALSVIFLLTTSPICVYNIVENFVEEALLDDPGGTAKLNLAWAVVNILMYTNSTVNFYLYCLSGGEFQTRTQTVFVLSRRTDAARLRSWVQTAATIHK